MALSFSTTRPKMRAVVPLLCYKTRGSNAMELASSTTQHEETAALSLLARRYFRVRKVRSHVVVTLCLREMLPKVKVAEVQSFRTDRLNSCREDSQRFDETLQTEWAELYFFRNAT
jgi:hypothetical protein